MNVLCSKLTFASILHGNRRRNKCLIYTLYLVVLMWFSAVLLSHYISGDRRHVGREAPKAARNVFEYFNSHKMRVLGFSLDEEYEDTNQSVAVIETKANHLLSENNAIRQALKGLRLESNPLLPKMDCASIIAGDVEAVETSKLQSLEFRGKAYAEKRKALEEFDKELLQMTTNCTNLLRERKYILTPLTAEEKAYPLAYIITIHTKLDMFERLLRSIYHRQNIYCIHVDKKSPADFIANVRMLVDCFPNVFIASTLTEVYYTHWSRVEADLNCLRDLVKKKKEVPWKYVINLCGQDFPLKTNFELTRALKSFHGYNNLESVTIPEHKKRRYELHFEMPDNSENTYMAMVKTSVKKSPSPLDTPMFAGSAYFIWKRQAVEFMLTDPTIQAFFKWNEDTYSPDEHLWATLQRWYPHVPGSFPPHEKYDLNELQSVTRLVKWGAFDSKVYPKCQGVFRRGVCLYGVGDLTWLIQQHHFFANKFAEVDPFAVECLDQWIRNRTLSQTYRYLADGFV